VSAGVKRNVAGLSYATSSTFIFSSSRRFWASNSAIAALVDTGPLAHLIAASWCRSKALGRLQAGRGRPPYVILHACNPTLAHRALRADPGVGLLLPYALIVYATGDGTSRVEVLDPEIALAAAGDNTVLAIVAREAKAHLCRVLDSLSASSQEL